MRQIARRSAITLLLLGAGLLAAAGAQAQSNGSQVERLTDLVVQTMPMGQIFDMLSADDPNWPVQEDPDAVSRGQLACLRDELSPAGYRRLKRTEVVAYVAENAARVDADIDVLANGGARVMNMLVMAGAESERTGVVADENEILSRASEDELAAFMAMFAGEEYSPLRALLGIGNAFAAENSAEENEAAGEEAGSDLATRVMFKSLDTCGIDRDALF